MEIAKVRKLRFLAAEPDPNAKFGERSALPGGSPAGQEQAGVCLVLGTPTSTVSLFCVSCETPFIS